MRCTRRGRPRRRPGRRLSTTELHGLAGQPNLLESYRWRLTTRPANSASVLSAVDTPTTLFVPDMPGFYGVTLDVFDNELWNTSPAVDTIDVVP